MTKRLDNPTGLHRGHETRPFIIGGERHYHVAAAGRIVGVSNATMWKWVSRGASSHGVELDAYDHYGFQRFVPESKVLTLKELVQQRRTSRAPAAPRPEEVFPHASVITRTGDVRIGPARPVPAQAFLALPGNLGPPVVVDPAETDGLSGGTPEPPKEPKGLAKGHERKPFVIDGVKHYHVAAAARMIGMCQRTLWKWAGQGVTSQGLDLDVYDHYGFQRFIPEPKVLLLRDKMRQRSKLKATSPPRL